MAGEGQAQACSWPFLSGLSAHAPLEDSAALMFRDGWSGIPDRETVLHQGQADGTARGAVAESVLQQVGNDLTHRSPARGLFGPRGPLLRPRPGPSLQIGHGFRPFDQRNQPFLEGDVGFGWAGGQQEWRGRITGCRKCRSSQAGKGIDVTTELVLFRQHPLHEGTVLTVRFKPAEQQLGIGAQRRQGIPQLMDQCAELILLLRQLVTQLKAFQFSGEAVADRSGTEAKPGIQIRGPILSGIQISPQCSEDQITVLQRVPATPAGRQAQFRIVVGGRQLPVIDGPLADQDEGGALIRRGLTQIQPETAQPRTP